MNKNRISNLFIFEEGVTERELSDLPEGFTGEVYVNGNVNISEDFCLPCSLLIDGELTCCKIKVDGNLSIKGNFDAQAIHVTKNFSFTENEDKDSDGYVGDIIVDGDCYYEGQNLFNSLSVSGALEFKEFKWMHDPYAKSESDKFKRVLVRTVKGTAIKVGRN